MDHPNRNIRQDQIVRVAPSVTHRSATFHLQVTQGGHTFSFCLTMPGGMTSQEQESLREKWEASSTSCLGKILPFAVPIKPVPVSSDAGQ